MVHIILVVYDQKQQLSKYKKIFDWIFVKYNLTIINNGNEWVDNAVVGTNQFREFGAYHQGYEHIKNTLKNEEIIAFINDTFLERRKFDGYFIYAYKLFYNLCKYKIIKGNFIVGEIHSIKKKILISSVELKEHISTYFFLTNKITIESINIDYMSQDVDLWFDRRIYAFQSQSLSEEYLSRLKNWLIRDASANKQWYRSAAVTEQNIEKIELKAKSIFKEHFLSFKASNNGTKLIGVYSKRKYTFSRLLLYILNKL